MPAMLPFTCQQRRGAGRGSSVPHLEGSPSPRLQEAHYKLGLHQCQE